MTYQIDTSMHWTEHFVEYGFAVAKGLVKRDFCNEALEQVKKIVDDPRPLDQWSSEKPGDLHEPFRVGRSDPVLRKLYDQPEIRVAIETMHGGPGVWNERETFYIFLKTYAPDAEPELSPTGHIDFGGQLVPIFYRGFAMMVSLVDTEPFSGNFTCWPGSHRIIQKMLMDDPTIQQPGDAFTELNKNLPEPYEFVSEVGDVLFIHHLLLHSGNASHSANRKPRLALLLDAWRDDWVTQIDPAGPDLSPWERSLALNGPYKALHDERAERAKADPEVAAEIEAEKAGLPMPR